MGQSGGLRVPNNNSNNNKKGTVKFSGAVILTEFGFIVRLPGRTGQTLPEKINIGTVSFVSKRGRN